MKILSENGADLNVKDTCQVRDYWKRGGLAVQKKIELSAKWGENKNGFENVETD